MCSRPASRAVRLVTRYAVSRVVFVTSFQVLPSPFRKRTVRTRWTLATCSTCGISPLISCGASMTRWLRVSARPWPLVRGDVAGGPGPAQLVEGRAEILAVLLHCEHEVRAQFLAGQYGEAVLRVQCVSSHDLAREGKVLVQLPQHGGYFRDLVRLGGDFPV